MMTVLAVVAAFLTGVAATTACAWLITSRGVWRLRKHRPMLITLKSGDGFRGVLASSDRHTLVLSDAQSVAETPIPVDGELIVQIADVRYAQRL